MLNVSLKSFLLDLNIVRLILIGQPTTQQLNARYVQGRHWNVNWGGGGGCIYICSCSTQRVSFQIKFKLIHLKRNLSGKT